MEKKKRGALVAKNRGEDGKERKVVMCSADFVDDELSELKRSRLVLYGFVARKRGRVGKKSDD